jgi:hypothetical protein
MAAMASDRRALLALAGEPDAFADADVHVAVVRMLLARGDIEAYGPLRACGAFGEWLGAHVGGHKSRAAEHTRRCVPVLGRRAGWARTVDRRWRAALRTPSLSAAELALAMEAGMAAADADAAAVLARGPAATSDGAARRTVEHMDAVLRGWWLRLEAQLPTAVAVAEPVREV